ncbi:hypothetical protein IKP85_06575 [bacterium]|nr:hypothetical protein [bacterium]
MDERDLLETSIDIEKYVTAKRDEIYRAIEEECWKQLDDMRLINLYKGCRTDCILKQIVEKCKDEIRVYRNTLLPNDGTNTLHFGRQSFAYDILKLLDIEECE